MGVSSSDKKLNVTTIDCGGSFEVTLSLTAEPDIVSNPTDIVLILDRSGSMTGTPLENLKEGANHFIDIIDEATDGVKDGQIGNGSRIGIVSFSNTATQNTQLITSVADLKQAVNSLTAGGSTNHADAFTKANELFQPSSNNARVMVMFTDGRTTAGPNPTPIADAAKALGAVIYIIGLVGSDGLDENALDAWASDPSSAYVSITPDDDELTRLFENLARNITNPGATDIVIDEILSSCFRIQSINAPSKGSAVMLNSTSLRWNIDELGVSQSEGAELVFTARHNGICTGIIPVNDSISYSDNEGNIVTFPSPDINVDCGTIAHPESCPVPVDINVDGCGDTVEIDAGAIDMQSLGRIVELDLTIQNVCPRRRVALAAILTEVDDQGTEYRRGLKIMTVPAHTAPSCRDILVRCIKFVLPEDLNVSGINVPGCGARSLRARFIAHYVDSGFDCCNTVN